MRTSTKQPAVRPISKEKLKESLPIMDVARKYSAKLDERRKMPLILCPFHEDHNLGSCRIYPDTNTFKCEACQTQGDMLKLASGFTGIPLSEMNRLLEELASSFGIYRDSITADYDGKVKRYKPPELLSAEQYTWLLRSDHYSIPIKFEEFEFENNEIEYWPTRYEKVYFRSLAIRDPELHDFAVCAISRRDWLNTMVYIDECRRGEHPEGCEFNKVLVKMRTELLYDALLDKKLYEPEMKERYLELAEILNKKRLIA